MRAKSEYPTRHADQHRPDGSDPLNAIYYNVHNIGEWLSIETTGVDTDTGVAIELHASGQISIDSDTDSIYLNALDSGGDLWAQVGQDIHLIAGADFFINVDNALTVNADSGDLEFSTDGQIVAGGGLLLQGSTFVDTGAGNTALRVAPSTVRVLLATGATFEVQDHLGAAKIQWTEGTTVLHIPTGGTVVADL